MQFLNNLGMCPDKFTGQERDGETGNDFFQARYLSSAQGRFLSPDPENAGADLYNPQSWNEYAYVSNNPLNATDPTGTTTCDANGDNCQDTVNVQGGSPDPIPLDWGIIPIGSIGNSGPPPPPSPIVQIVQNTVITIGNFLTAPRDPNCVKGAAVAGAAVGATGGNVSWSHRRRRWS